SCGAGRPVSAKPSAYPLRAEPNPSGKTSHGLDRPDPVGLDGFPQRVGDPAGDGGGRPLPARARAGGGLAASGLLRGAGRPAALPPDRPGEATPLAAGAAGQAAPGDGPRPQPARPSPERLSPRSRAGPVSRGDPRGEPRPGPILGGNAVELLVD